MVAKLTILTHKIAIQLHLVAESCTIFSSRSRRPVRKLLDTPSYKLLWTKIRCRLLQQLESNLAVPEQKKKATKQISRSADQCHSPTSVHSEWNETRCHESRLIELSDISQSNETYNDFGFHRNRK
jgi:hypothetical protein